MVSLSEETATNGDADGDGDEEGSRRAFDFPPYLTSAERLEVRNDSIPPPTQQSRNVACATCLTAHAFSTLRRVTAILSQFDLV